MLSPYTKTVTDCGPPENLGLRKDSSFLAYAPMRHGGSPIPSFPAIQADLQMRCALGGNFMSLRSQATCHVAIASRLVLVSRTIGHVVGRRSVVY